MGWLIAEEWGLLQSELLREMRVELEVTKISKEVGDGFHLVELLILLSSFFLYLCLSSAFYFETP